MCVTRAGTCATATRLKIKHLLAGSQVSVTPVSGYLAIVARLIR
jgi:hypothetical protein